MTYPGDEMTDGGVTWDAVSEGAITGLRSVSGLADRTLLSGVDAVLSWWVERVEEKGDGVEMVLMLSNKSSSRTMGVVLSKPWFPINIECGS